MMFWYMKKRPKNIGIVEGSVSLNREVGHDFKKGEMRVWVYRN